jgi:hypothetical protein
MLGWGKAKKRDEALKNIGDINWTNPLSREHIGDVGAYLTELAKTYSADPQIVSCVKDTLLNMARADVRVMQETALNALPKMESFSRVRNNAEKLLANAIAEACWNAVLHTKIPEGERPLLTALAITRKHAAFDSIRENADRRIKKFEKAFENEKGDPCQVADDGRIWSFPDMSYLLHALRGPDSPPLKPCPANPLILSIS